jgi:CHAT domain-containing protein
MTHEPNISSRRLVPRTEKTALVAGINVYDQLPSLINSRPEAQAIATLFEIEPFLDADVTPETIFNEARNKAYLHLACHGSFAWGDNPLASSLYLSGDEPLLLSEIMNKLDLNSARLVTLSACETGMIDIDRSPDEFLGLPAGFMQAGAPGVVCSLWAVDDQSTKFLMIRFYRNLLNGKNPSQALREAQLWLRDASTDEIISNIAPTPRYTVKDDKVLSSKELPSPEITYASPYYWAAFTLNGL